MASKTFSTLDGHLEVNKRKDTQALPVSGKHKAYKPHPSWTKRLLLYCNLHHEMREAPHLLEYTMLQITVFLRRMESSDSMSILAR